MSPSPFGGVEGEVEGNGSTSLAWEPDPNSPEIVQVGISCQGELAHVQQALGLFSVCLVHMG